mgnify:CR=1 FL=1
MYERSAIVLEKYFNKIFGFNEKNNLKNLYNSYKNIIEETCKYQEIIGEEEKQIEQFDQIANEIRNIQQEQKKLYKSNIKLEEDRNKLFDDLDEDPALLEKKLEKIGQTILSNNERLEELKNGFTENLNEFNERQKERNKCSKARRIEEGTHIQLIEELKKELKKTSRRVDIITAFCKIDSLKYLDEYIPKDVIKRLLIRFRLSDLLMGVTDIELFEYCKNNNWELYIDTNLHAKIYLVDNTCYIGSANLTNGGLGITKIGNIEVSYKFELNKEEDNIKLEKLFDESIKLDDILYQKMKIDYKENKHINVKEVKWNNEIEEKLKEKFDILLQEDFPINEYPNNLKTDEGYLGIEMNDSMEEIKRKFEDTKIMKWLIYILKSKENKEIYFGELTERIHTLIFKEPKVYRMEVKDLQSKLYNWLIILNYDYLSIDTPIHSTRIRLLK